MHVAVPQCMLGMSVVLVHDRVGVLGEVLMMSLILGERIHNPSEGGVNITLWTRHVNSRQVNHDSCHVSGEQTRI